MSLPTAIQSDLLLPEDALSKPFYVYMERVKDHFLGLEYEVFLWDKEEGKRASYEKMCRLLTHWPEEHTVIQELGVLIGIRTAGGGTLSLEPGGQLEYSAPPVKSVNSLAGLLHTFMKNLVSIATSLNLSIHIQGFDDYTSLKDVPWTKRPRHRHMYAHMTRYGEPLAHAMMGLTCGVQLNIDYEDEAMLTWRFQIATGLQPLATALWSNSAVSRKEGAYVCYRNYIWHHTEPSRCGFVGDMIGNNAAIAAYTRYAAERPMYFMAREDAFYFPSVEISFQKLQKNPSLQPVPLLWSDWIFHLTTLFPFVRLKPVLEIRGSDSVDLEKTLAFCAWWAGILYAPREVQDTLSKLMENITLYDIQEAQRGVSFRGLDQVFAGKTLTEWHKIVTPIALQGLKKREYGEEKWLLGLL